MLGALEGIDAFTLAQPSFFKAYQQTKNAIYNGRPHYRTGPPIELFHPIFGSFLAGLDPSQDVPPEQLSTTLDLIRVSEDLYHSEVGPSGRAATLVPVLHELLDAALIVREAGGAKADGSISAKNGAFCLIMELEKEGGSDPGIHGAIAYAKYWSDVRGISFNAWVNLIFMHLAYLDRDKESVLMPFIYTCDCRSLDVHSWRRNAGLPRYSAPHWV